MLQRDTDSTTTAVGHTGPFEYRFTPLSPVSIRLGRKVFAQWLQAQPGVDVDGIDDLLVAVSELCTNAVAHASGRPNSVALRGWVVDDAVVFEVEDDGGGFDDPGVIDRASLDPEAEHGRGLFLVQALVDEVTFERSEGRMVVRGCKDGMLRSGTGSSSPGLSARFQR